MGDSSITVRNMRRGTVVVALLAVAAVSAVGTANAKTEKTDEVYVDAADEPCVLVSAADVRSALGIADADSTGTAQDLGTIGACRYGDSPGAVFQIANTFKTDGGRGVKQVCQASKAKENSDYRDVKGVGKRACTFTASVLGRPAPTMVLYALRKGSAETGRTIELRVSGSDEALAAISSQLDAGFATLGKKAAAFVKEEAIG
jgi:hypothetical protein